MACNEAVLKFLEDHNRPFSANEIQSGAKGDFGKSAVQKALDFLVQKQKVTEKIYGKQKVYCITQNTGESASELRERLLESNRTIAEKTAELKELEAKYATKYKMMAEIKGKVSLSAALFQKANLEKEIAEIKMNLNKYDGVEMVCTEKINAAVKVYEMHLKEFRKRRRMGMEMLNAILENYPKTKKQLYEDIGIETDEDAGFSMEKFN